ncbi:hypothetical protein L798_14407 [Zootermopsis nevadensis]|uniref:Uncharacterized protein n=1 Tax=Zootermopsis nevadensis TaxID=136037 RepID=A0A067R286_ZOONE|nr:hypothetical protein L798_14407 [Zootermopsis nevadensis]
MAVVLVNVHTARSAFTRSPPGTTVGGLELTPTKKAFSYLLTNFNSSFVFIVFVAGGSTSPLYSVVQAKYYLLLWAQSPQKLPFLRAFLSKTVTTSNVCKQLTL